MIEIKSSEVWLIVGSQHLYGDETLEKVASHASQIAGYLNDDDKMPVSIVFKQVVTTSEEIYACCQEANAASRCIGIIAWMHTFSPAKMWIRGLKILQRPLLHLHTQFGRDIPWQSIDMDFMNLNQSAHGDREFGHLLARMKVKHKVVTGFWKDSEVIDAIAIWARAAAAWHDWQGAKFVRFGDNMRNVAVTEGDKVEAEIQFGFSVNTYGTGDLVAAIAEIDESSINRLISEYKSTYTVSDKFESQHARKSIFEAARIELGLLAFLEQGGYKGFTDTFEDLSGLSQLPGIAVQRLMAKGYGFAGEGDWKTAALVRACKVMAAGLKGANAFMEDYTYHLEPGNSLVLGSHMLEVDASLAQGTPSLEIHPLSIGGKADPVRLVFNGRAGAATNSSLVDLGTRFRLVISQVETVTAPAELPQLPVARVLWKPLPDFNTSASAWLYAGGSHHTAFSENLTSEHLEEFAMIAGIESVTIGKETILKNFLHELRWNESSF